MTHCSEMEIFLGWSQWESCSPGYTCDMPCLQKSRLPYKKLTFCPKYPNFWVKKAHFCPWRPIGASMINVFNMKKVSHWNPDMRVPKFYSLSPKNWILGPKTAKFGPKLAFWAKYRHFWPI